MELATSLPGCALRPWRAADRDNLVRHANQRQVWRNLTDSFPHPYTVQDADGWLALCAEPGRGIANAAARSLGDQLLGAGTFARLQATVFAWNPASMRVLEKAGFVREGLLRHSVTKDGCLIDSVLYARTAA